MEVRVTAAFDGMEDGKVVKYRVGDIIDGPNAQWALDNGHAKPPKSASSEQPRRGQERSQPQQRGGQDGQ
jgi:hypothetical protein